MNSKGIALCAFIAIISVVVFLLGADSSQAYCEGLYPKYTVQIFNSIGSGINVRCKSKDDDLGTHYLAPVQSYYFSFKPNIWGTTLFYCSVRWNGRTEYFDAFNIDRGDRIVCVDHDCLCTWRLTPDGPCFYTYDRCLPWKPKPESMVKHES
uniref:S-protein homolog n=1 Tax=Kalanchoe fedtschenkoi TaxID=63787 RepID=A0A7N0ZVH0_KALFE